MANSIWKLLKFRTNSPSLQPIKRSVSQIFNDEKCSDPRSRGLVLGVYSNEDDKLDIGLLTPMAAKYNEVHTNGRLVELLRIAGPMPKRGESRIFYNLEPNFSAIAVCGLGNRCLGYDTYEQLDEGKEAIRIAAATGCKELQKLETSRIYVESFGDAESAAEGANMGLWLSQENRNLNNRTFVPQLQFHSEPDLECDWVGWKIGTEKAKAQNLARQLQETPANYMTPTKFAQNVVQVLCNSGVNVEVKVRGWAESQKMSSFLAVSKGSCEPPIFLELSYYGTDREERPIVLIGQGNTFDSGGVCLKKCHEMLDMRGDMAGAATVIATCRAIASMKLPVNIRGLIPLCEHMVGCNAIKPGDVITAMNGKSIEVVNTDNEAPLVLVDALLYAQNFWPKFVIDVSTLSESMTKSFGEICSGVYTNSEELWQKIKHASIHTGDRVWRMPLWDSYGKQIKSAEHVDVQNIAPVKGGESCVGAAFLREFVPCGQWMHIDAYNVMTTKGDGFPYLRRGMAGRPTRTLIEMIAKMTCQEEENGKDKKVVRQ